MMRAAFFLIGTLIWSAASFAQGGPPLLTDDPETIPQGTWEINTAAMWRGGDQNRALAFPFFDINYGAGANLQLKLETGWITEMEPNLPSVGGMTTDLVG